MENLPQETETIAVKRAVRINEKIIQARNRFSKHKKWWSSSGVEVSVLGLLFLLNVYLISDFFGTSAANTVFSGPVIPFIAKIISLFNIPFGYSVQITNILFFLLFPLSYYIFIKSLTGRKICAFLALFIVLLPFYPFTKVRSDFAFLGADSAHVASLSLIPISLYGAITFVRRGGIKALIFASLTVSFISLISPFGIITYMIMGAISTFSEILLGNGRLKIFRFITVLVVGMALSSFWYNPAYLVWMITGPMGEEIRLLIGNLIPISFFTAPVLLTFGYLLFDRKPNLQSLFLAIFYSAIFIIMVFVGGGFFNEHAPRYAAELGMSLAFFIGVVVMKVADYISFLQFDSKRGKIPGSYISLGIIFALFALMLVRIVVGKGSLREHEFDILGIWTGVDRTDIWVAKDKFNGIYSIIGYAITVTTLGFLSYLQLSVRKTPSSHEETIKTS